MIAGLCESPLTFQAIIIWRDELNEAKILLREIIDLEATYAGALTALKDRVRESGHRHRIAAHRCLDQEIAAVLGAESNRSVRKASGAEGEQRRRVAAFRTDCQRFDILRALCGRPDWWRRTEAVDYAARRLGQRSEVNTRLLENGRGSGLAGLGSIDDRQGTPIAKRIGSGVDRRGILAARPGLERHHACGHPATRPVWLPLWPRGPTKLLIATWNLHVFCRTPHRGRI